MPLSVSRRSRQRRRSSKAAAGMALAEFTIVAMPLLLAGLAAIELGRWWVVRQAVGYALFEAARAGSVDHARPAAIALAFEHGLAPLLGAADAGKSAAAIQASIRAARVRFADRYGLPMWQLDLVSPSTAAFDDFADPALSRRLGARAIDNVYQHERHVNDYSRRYPEGKGAASRGDIHAANVLTLEVIYLHAPIVPGLRQLLRQLAPTGQAYADAARRQGMAVMRRRVSMPMQSAPVEALPRARSALPPP